MRATPSWGSDLFYTPRRMRDLPISYGVEVDMGDGGVVEVRLCVGNGIPVALARAFCNRPASAAEKVAVK